MTDKEYKEAVRKKAEELIERFSKNVVGFPGDALERDNAAKCAKIAVQEILDLDVVWYRKEAVGKPLFIRPEMTREFWEEIMKELNK
ncbi:hypothetical protein [Petrimonas sulfuriphila]|uniref:hypothetical protein n=1 Tax=Petrimonas sulfuriphila TaxID=285070 RepID=UPI003EBD5B52